MKENLKTTKYNDGSSIIYPGTDNTAWENNTTGAYAWYDNDNSWNDSYGALYNWNAVSNANSLCPTGWHVPTNADWTQLVDYVVAQGFPNSNLANSTGNALKSCREVNSPWGGACNTTTHPRWNEHVYHHGFDEFSFSGLPGGIRYVDGNFSPIGNFGYWWSSMGFNAELAWGQGLGFNRGNMNVESSVFKLSGLSVRCLKNDNLILEVEPPSAGTVIGAGHYAEYDPVIITASANPGYVFVNWTKGTNVEATTTTHTYIMSAYDVTLTANFVLAQAGFSCGDLLIDARDGQSYETVQIGTQCWMAENLNVGTRIDGIVPQSDNFTIEKYCYDNLDANCVIYGGLYLWDEMMQYTTTPDVQGICPAGWHIPTDIEWTALTTFLNSQPACMCNSNTEWIAKSLAATTHWNTNSSICAIGNNLSTNNTTGFTGLPGGNRGATGGFGSVGFNSYWWSSTETITDNAWYRYMDSNGSNVSVHNSFKSHGFSVRCLRD
jgi:uncharacterized protein (TIGR02145 family)